MFIQKWLYVANFVFNKKMLFKFDLSEMYMLTGN